MFWFAYEISPFSLGVLDLQGRGDYALEHLNPAGLPRACRSWVFPFLAQILPVSRDLKFPLLRGSFSVDLLGIALE